jgi:phosphatidate phosphatase APP1
MMTNKVSVKVYYGYGHTHDLVLYGHVFGNKENVQKKFTNSVFVNIVNLLRLFFVKPLPRVKVRLQWKDQQLETLTEDDGFFKFEWRSVTDIAAGRHALTVTCIDEAGAVVATGEGELYVPHVSQYAFISDIDDTVLVSYSATKFRRLKELLTRNPRTRHQFEKVADWYQQLALTYTTADTPNPFFYVSSSEWNLYDYLREFFRFNKLPDGIFLLNQIKRWFQFFKTGKTKHSGKLLRILRILNIFPKQQFVLIGDNSQQDPAIYTSIAIKYPEKIFAIFIRNVKPENERAALLYLKAAEAEGVHTLLFKGSDEAAAHSRTIGLLR